MKTKLLISVALVAVCAALPASAKTIELLTNGRSDGTLDGWTNTGPSKFEIYNDGDNYWFEADDDDSSLSQTIDLAEKGITPDVIATEPTMTASIIARGGYAGRASVEQFDADGKGLARNDVVYVYDTIGATPYSIRFKLKPNARKLKYELSAYRVFGLYMLKFRDCSLGITLPTMVTFVSEGRTLGTAAYVAGETAPTAPTASRGGNYRFLGYFTEETGGDKIYDENYAFAQSSSWEFTTDAATLYAQWGISDVNLSFVSQGATVGTATYMVASDTITTVPTATRPGDYVFLGYFTEEKGGVRVFDENCQYVEGSLSSLSTELTLYAHWAIPGDSAAKLVYRGQLNLLGSDRPATNATAYTKTMHFKVYDDEAAETPVWQALDQQVSVNRDGSFTAMFGDETLAALIATGKVTHVGVSIGPNAGQAIELKPRRALRPVAAVNRALAAEAAGKDPRVGNLVTENALAANNVTVSMLEVAGTVTAPGAEAVTVAPVVVGEHETLTLLRGDGMHVFSGQRVDLGTTGPVQRGQKVGNPAPSDGIALIASCQGGTRALRIPGVIQYCRKGEYARAPATEPNGVKVTFFPFVGK
ncbi:MAG: hypothetical protein ILO10_08875 [Kiritimatiellae bacterium]|nr:hypothetical protein [Kiritimatiellia bacterium]